MVRVICIVLGVLVSTFVCAKQPSIGTSKAVHYELASKEKINEDGYGYIFVCAVSKAIGKDERAQTMVKVLIDLQNDTSDTKIALYLAADKALCQEGRLIGTAYYSPDGSGWKSVAQGSWTWNILTTDAKVTDQQVSDTILYESNKPKFKKRYGVYDYSEKLDEYVKSQLGRKPEYVTTGLWVDTYHVE